MEAITIKQPETITLTYDKSNRLAKKTLDLFLSSGIFQVEKNLKRKVKNGLEEYLTGKYSVINNGKNMISDIETLNKKKERSNKTDSNFTLSAGIWEDYDIDATKLRRKAWKIQE